MLFPLPKSAVTTMFKDTFGDARSGGREHHGTDISVPSGTPILAVEAGKVYETGNNSLDGNYLILQGSSGYKYRYSHLSGVSVSKGQTVQAGSTLGASGATGNAEGPHLHFGMSDQDGAAVNPYQSLLTAYNGSGSGVDVVDSSGSTVEDKKGKVEILGVTLAEWSWYDVGAVVLGVAGVVIIAYRLAGGFGI